MAQEERRGEEEVKKNGVAWHRVGGGDERAEGESEAKRRWNQWLIGHFTSFHPAVK